MFHRTKRLQVRVTALEGQMARLTAWVNQLERESRLSNVERLELRPSRKVHVWKAPLCSWRRENGVQCSTHTKHESGACIVHRGMITSVNGDSPANIRPARP